MLIKRIDQVYLGGFNHQPINQTIWADEFHRKDSADRVVMLTHLKDMHFWTVKWVMRTSY